MNKELKQRAKDFFAENGGTVTGQMLYERFTDPDVDELRRDGLLEHVIFDEWHWKGD